jgi:hypothetical protein
MRVDVREHLEPTLPYAGLVALQHGNLRH